MNLEQEITKDYKKQAFLRDDGRCRYCGLDFMQSLSSFWSYTVDHLLSKSAGGEEVCDNIVTCCKACSDCLSRSDHLHTFEDRRDYILSSEADRTLIYKAWRERLGRGA